MYHCKSQVLSLLINQPKDKFRAAYTGRGKFGISLIFHLIEEKAKHFILNQPSQLVFVQFFLNLVFVYILLLKVS